ncbi:F0F1 ATP synthase subunit A [Dysgonomonas sp. 25]|uniref:F0F1 ATP synthase subunit A n=1 Tax=Dysgonomonas sp. 25 TaxID=2302933 RepID=UPI0013D52CA2|nr:F0F1 ATP synthase subunit A [Dysgonomonas sp. 25]NDV68225.1 ATP synthase F0 subunit A [Dysgonomonas sp. 25]
MRIMNNYLKYIVLTCVLLMASLPSVYAAGGTSEDGKVDVTGMVMDHVSDGYEWHIATWNDTHISIPLPVILYSEQTGFHTFLSSHFHHGTEAYNGFYIAQSGDYKGKIVEKNAAGEEIRPWDISITKNTLSLMMGSILLLIIILGVARWYKKNSKSEVPVAPKGFVGFMEMFIMDLVDNMIKPCIGKNYRKFTPYLLTAFFFIFLNNLMGLIPIFPGGANVTGNISVTVVLALFTFFMVNFFGTKEYWKEIFWPDVPVWLKSPIMPIMPVIELVGVFTKPFALMIRLFANILAGHSIVLGLMSLIFVTASMGAAVSGSMTFVSVLMTIFMNIVELLVAYIQAYVFTMLSAVFIGLAQVEPHHAKEKH